MVGHVSKTSSRNKEEKKIQDVILRDLNRLPGVFAWRTPNRGIYIKQLSRYVYSDAPKGVPDISGVLGPSGCFFGIEVKASRRPREGSLEQQSFIQELLRLGCRAGIARNTQEALEVIGWTDRWTDRK